MICPYCGEELKDTAKFCTNCGKKQLPAEAAEEKPAFPEASGTEPTAGPKPGASSFGSNPTTGSKPGASDRPDAEGVHPEPPAGGSAQNGEPKPSSGSSSPKPDASSFDSKPGATDSKPGASSFDAKPGASGSVCPPPPQTDTVQASSSVTAGDILLAAACLAEILLSGWFKRLLGIAAAVFCVLSYLRRRNGDTVNADSARRTCIILLIIGGSCWLAGVIIGFIFNLGARIGVLSWFKDLIMELLQGV